MPVNLLLQANTIQVYDPQSSLPHIYDLKGSWNHRIVVKGENQTKKDRNLLNCIKSKLRKGEKGILQFQLNDIKEINQIIEKDVKFLMGLGLLDYSLLMAVEKIKTKSKIKQMQDEQSKKKKFHENIRRS